MKHKILLSSAILIFFFASWYCPAPVANNESSCVKCHTNETLLKKLCRKQTPAQSAGERRTEASRPVSAEAFYRGFLVNGKLLEKDPHFEKGCSFCHNGNEAGLDKDSSHKGLVTRPSDNVKTCGQCHPIIAYDFNKSLHFTAMGQRTGVCRRFSQSELKEFDERVFEKSCRSCHASCGDCHVQSPSVGGSNMGLIRKHAFVRKDEGKTCGYCHGSSVYPEFTGCYGGNPDIHFQKGMGCVDCHNKHEIHGDGISYKEGNAVKERPSCRGCHKPGQELESLSRLAHSTHEGRVSCYGCHSGGEYRNCYGCHLGKGSTSKPGFMLGLNPRDKKSVTTLRLAPTTRETFSKSGLKMEHYDDVPNYWDSPVHNIGKQTDRTRACDSCHSDRKGFLTREMLIEKGSKANNGLLYTPSPLQ